VTVLVSTPPDPLAGRLLRRHILDCYRGRFGHKELAVASVVRVNSAGKPKRPALAITGQQPQHEEVAAKEGVNPRAFALLAQGRVKLNRRLNFGHVTVLAAFLVR